ncbi:beta strand repeat-containing protein [Helicobacter pullorum]|uniref:beta strand repeat-containing protein n=3 Tax=Helicobacter pullorum TaxID=35818 RepID=UPI00242F2521|nr:S-layer family protein [Helicobacter pullorum]
MYGGGGANKPLTNSLTTSNTLKNSNPKKLSKNLNKIQSSNLSKESNINLDSKESNSKIQDSIKLDSIKDSNSIQSKQSKTTITKIGISIVASIVLSQSLVALPSGGKFTHGSGSIKVNGKEMDITGNNKNHIIAWGGGFNINQGEVVNFDTSHKNPASFLNLDYSNQASQILGKLNGNNHNIYLVNPSGVLVGKGASINANKFVASNTIDETTLNNFKNKVDSNPLSFSPVFKANKGNVVNLGDITASEIVLAGNIVEHKGTINGLNGGKATTNINANKIQVSGSISANDLTFDAKESLLLQNGGVITTNNATFTSPILSIQGIEITAENALTLGANTSKVEMNAGTITAPNISILANDLNLLGGDITANNGNITIDVQTPLYLQGIKLTATKLIDLKSTEDIEVSNSAVSANEIKLVGDDILLSSGTLDSTTKTTLNATNKLEISGNSQLSGNGLEATAKNIAFLGGAIEHSSVALKNSGTLLLNGGTLQASDSLILGGDNATLVEIGKTEINNTGSLNASANKVSLLNANINTTQGIDITSKSDSLILQGSTITSTTGDITLNAQDKLELSNNSTITSTNGGFTATSSDDSIVLNRGTIAANTNNGTIALNAKTLVEASHNSNLSGNAIKINSTAGNILMRWAKLNSTNATTFTSQGKIEIGHGSTITSNGFNATSKNNGIILNKGTINANNGTIALNANTLVEASNGSLSGNVIKINSKTKNILIDSINLNSTGATTFTSQEKIEIGNGSTITSNVGFTATSSNSSVVLNKETINAGGGNIALNANTLVEASNNSNLSGNTIKIDSTTGNILMRLAKLNSTGATTLTGQDKIEIGNNSTITSNGGFTANSSGGNVILNQGTITGGNINLTASNNAKVEIANATLSGNQIIANAGTIGVFSGTTLSGSASQAGAGDTKAIDLNATSLLEIQGGTFNANNNEINLKATNSGGTIRVTGGTFNTKKTNLNASNAGTILIDGGTINSNIWANGGNEIIANGNYSFGVNKDSKLQFIGNKVTLDTTRAKTNQSKIEIDAKNSGEYIINITEFGDSRSHSFGHLTDTNSNVRNIVGIEKADGWRRFANAWNNNRGTTRTAVDEFRLIGDVDLSGVSHYTFTGNSSPANTYIVGATTQIYYDNPQFGRENAFSGNFNGNGYTIKGLNIVSVSGIFHTGNRWNYLGLFGAVNGGTIRNLNLDNMQMLVQYENRGSNNAYVGMLAGWVNNATISDITAKNIGLIAGSAFDISLGNNPSNVVAKTNGEAAVVGGMFGSVNGTSSISNIALNYKSGGGVQAGGGGNYNFAGGFAGEIIGVSGKVSLSNIVVTGLSEVTVKDTSLKLNGNSNTQSSAHENNFGGAFVGRVYSVDLKDVFVQTANSVKVDMSADGISSYGAFYGLAGNHLTNNSSNTLSLHNVGVYSSWSGIRSWTQDDTSYNTSGGTGSGFSFVDGKITKYTNNSASLFNNLFTRGGSTQIGNKDIWQGSPSVSNSGGVVTFATTTAAITNIANTLTTSSINNASSLSSAGTITGASGITDLDLVSDGTNAGELGAISTPNVDLDADFVISDNNIPVEDGKGTQEDYEKDITDIFGNLVMDLLNENYGLQIENTANTNFSNIYFGSDTLATLYELLLDKDSYDSVKQSIDFLNSIEIDSNGLIAGLFDKDSQVYQEYTKAMEQYQWVETNLQTLKDFSTGDLKSKVSSILSDLKRLENIKLTLKNQEKAYNDMVDKGLLDKPTQEGIKVAIENLYKEGEMVLENLKANGEWITDTILLDEPYLFSEVSDFDTASGSFTFGGDSYGNGMNLGEWSIKQWEDGLGDLNLKEPGQGENPDTRPTPPTTQPSLPEIEENDPNIPDSLRKESDILSKKPNFILPAEEEEEVINEERERFRGRTCIVSDNAKTNNPCLAITY